jgi:hypothetical protein
MHIDINPSIHLVLGLSVPTEDSSFKKTQECMRVVAKEFRFQGHELRGPCAALKKAGTNGKYSRNIARDVQRRYGKLHGDPASPFPRAQQILIELFWCLIYFSIHTK